MTQRKTPQPVEGPALRDYFMEHVVPVKGKRNIFRVVKPLHVFKKAKYQKPNTTSWLDRRDVIVNLIIPVGAHVHADVCAFIERFGATDRKMRASEAQVHSIVNRNKNPVDLAWSIWDTQFKYVPGASVRPKRKFSPQPAVCASGIHFFLNVADALDYK